MSIRWCMFNDWRKKKKAGGGAGCQPHLPPSRVLSGQSAQLGLPFVPSTMARSPPSSRRWWILTLIDDLLLLGAPLLPEAIISTVDVRERNNRRRRPIWWTFSSSRCNTFARLRVPLIFFSRDLFAPCIPLSWIFPQNAITRSWLAVKKKKKKSFGIYLSSVCVRCYLFEITNINSSSFHIYIYIYSMIYYKEFLGKELTPLTECVFPHL